MFTNLTDKAFYHESSEFYSFHRPYYCGGRPDNGVRIALYDHM